MTYWISSRARRDLRDIWHYIAYDSEAAADRLWETLHEHFRRLARNPRIGRRRDDLRPGYRSFPVEEHLILYRIGPPGVRIARVIHGRRDLSQALN